MQLSTKSQTQDVIQHCYVHTTLQTLATKKLWQRFFGRFSDLNDLQSRQTSVDEINKILSNFDWCLNLSSKTMSLISFNINLAYKSGINVKTITNFVESKKTSSLPIKPIIGSFHVVLNKQNKERKKANYT